MSQEVEARYFVEAAAKALDVLESFSTVHEELTTTDIVRRAGIGYCSTFRMLYTLERRGYVMRVAGSKRYRLVPARMRFRVGYAATDGEARPDEVAHGLILAAKSSGVELLVRNRGCNPANALANVDSLLDEGVQLVIVRQPHECAAEPISTRCRNLSVPAIAINYAHPGATYFGPDHVQLGRQCGDYAGKRLASERARLLVLLPAPVNEARHEFLRGLMEGVRRTGGPRPVSVSVPAGAGYTWVQQALGQLGSSRDRSLVIAGSDAIFAGCLRAVGNMHATEAPAILAVAGGEDSISRLRSAGPRAAIMTCLPETYGQRVLSLAIRLLEGRLAGPVLHSQAVLLTPDNVDDYYPDYRPARVARRPVIEYLFPGGPASTPKAG